MEDTLQTPPNGIQPGTSRKDTEAGDEREPDPEERGPILFSTERVGS